MRPQLSHHTGAAQDSLDLQRFVDAQQDTYPQALQELREGRKTSHWMWFVFPQLSGLGRSYMAERYGIASLEEARAYLAHPLLGPRLMQCTQQVLAIQGRSIHEIFGSRDDLKFRSCMTLFRRAAPDEALFAHALRQCCGGVPCARTIDLPQRDDLN